MVLESFQRNRELPCQFFCLFFFCLFSPPASSYSSICCKYLSALRKAAETEEWLGVFRKPKYNNFSNNFYIL